MAKYRSFPFLTIEIIHLQAASPEMKAAVKPANYHTQCEIPSDSCFRVLVGSPAISGQNPQESESVPLGMKT